MPKPLELTIYPKTCTCHFEEATEGSPAGVTHVPLSCLMHGARVAVFGKRKRLTGPELAAEYWMHEGEFNMVCEGYSIDSFGGVYRSGREDELIMQAQLDTLLRFATLPHYDEETP